MAETSGAFKQWLPPSMIQNIHCGQALTTIQNTSVAGAMLVTTTGGHFGWFGLFPTGHGSFFLQSYLSFSADTLLLLSNVMPSTLQSPSPCRAPNLPRRSQLPLVPKNLPNFLLLFLSLFILAPCPSLLLVPIASPLVERLLSSKPTPRSSSSRRLKRWLKRSRSLKRVVGFLSSRAQPQILPPGQNFLQNMTSPWHALPIHSSPLLLDALSLLRQSFTKPAHPFTSLSTSPTNLFSPLTLFPLYTVSPVPMALRTCKWQYLLTVKDVE